MYFIGFVHCMNINLKRIAFDSMLLFTIKKAIFFHSRVLVSLIRSTGTPFHFHTLHLKFHSYSSLCDALLVPKTFLIILLFFTSLKKISSISKYMQPKREQGLLCIIGVKKKKQMNTNSNCIERLVENIQIFMERNIFAQSRKLPSMSVLRLQVHSFTWSCKDHAETQ